MAIVITNGNYYISHSNTGKLIKVTNIEEAQNFYEEERAIKFMMKHPSKTKSYYYVDTENGEFIQFLRERMFSVKAKKKNKVKRKSYSQSVRKMIYNNADGRCQLCGRKIKFEQMSIDHIQPLAMNGADCISNLQCTCREDNLFKGSIEPEAFLDRITTIFMYQMEKKYTNKLTWKIVHRLLTKMI